MRCWRSAGGAQAEGGATAVRSTTPVDAPTAEIVDAAVANADVLGAQPLGQIAGAFRRAKFADGTSENRGGESTLGNLVAEVQRWATRRPGVGLGADRVHEPRWSACRTWSGTGATATRETLTYRQAANVQPFANTLVNMDLTGAQIKATLEQQWQPAGARRVRSCGSVRPRASRTPTTRPRPPGSRITGMWLDGDADRAWRRRTR